MQMLLSQFISVIDHGIIFWNWRNIPMVLILEDHPALKSTKFSTRLSFYSIWHLQVPQFSGPLCGTFIWYSDWEICNILSPNFYRDLSQIRISYCLRRKRFFGEMVFLLRTFFFVFIGVSIKSTDWIWLFYGYDNALYYM